MVDVDRELLERLAAQLERLEAERAERRQYERERKARYRARLRGEDQEELFGDRPAVQALRPVRTESCPGDMSRGQNAVPGTCPGDNEMSRGQASSESESGGTSGALKIDRSIDLIDDRSIDREKDDRSILCQDGQRFIPPASVLTRYPGLDPDVFWCDLRQRLSAKPDLSPRSLASAPAWFEVAVANAARSAHVGPADRPARPQPRPSSGAPPPPIELRPTGPPATIDGTPLARRLAALNRKESS